MSNATRIQNPVRPTDIAGRLLNRGVVKVNLADVADQYLAERGVVKSHAAIRNNVCAAVRMLGDGMFTKALDTTVKGDILELRLNGNAPTIPVESIPRVIKKMIAKGNKFSPTIAGALAEQCSIEVPVNPQASV